MPPLRFLAPVLATLASSGAALAQTPATQLHYSSGLGGSGFDLGAGIHRLPNGFVLLVGTTTSAAFPTTAGALQTARLGPSDAFVACLDLAAPPSQQIVWCTLLGGTGTEVAFASQVDAAGFLTLVGLTDSTDFPTNAAVPGHQTSLNGPSDGFMARIDPTGTALQYSTYFGGSSHDRLCSVTTDTSGRLFVMGVTESADLPNTAGTSFPTYQGGNTDAMLACFDLQQAPAQQLRWACYVGGPLQEGPPYSAIAAGGGLGNYWEGNLDRQNLVAMLDGTIALATVCNASTPSMATPGSLRTSNWGADVYVASFDPNFGLLQYGTFYGGSAVEVPWGMAAHPDGGVVLAGLTSSGDLPVSTNPLQTSNRFGSVGSAADGFVCWIDPGRVGGQQLRYGTYCGGDGGEDILTGLHVDSAGTVTIIGTAIGGGALPFHTTPGSHNPRLTSADRCGTILRMRLENQGARDLMYGTVIGSSWTVLEGLAIDPLGDVYVIGSWGNLGYPMTANALQATHQGMKDVGLTHLPMLPGGTYRESTALATPACGAPLTAAVFGAPTVGNVNFGLCATQAPPQGLGVMVFGFAPPVGGQTPLLNATLLVDPVVSSGLVSADAHGFARVPLAIPAATPVGLQVLSQWLFLTNSTCSGSGLVAASERLVVTTF